MPIAKFQLPDGRVAKFEVPDGTTPEQAQGMMTQYFSANRDGTTAQQQAVPQPTQEPTWQQKFQSSAPVRFVQGLRDPIDAAAKMLPKGLEAATSLGGIAPNPVSRFFGDEASRVQGINEKNEAQYQASRQASGDDGMDVARLGGQVLSPAYLAIGGNSPAAASLGGRVVQGAKLGSIGGALSNNDVNADDYWMQKAKDVGLGAAIGGAIPLATGAAARVLKPNTNQQVKALIAEGVTPTPGQILGGAFKSGEEKLQSVPIIGDAISGAKRKANEEFNRAVLSRALKPLGETAKKVGREGIEEVEKKISSVYDDILPKMTFKADAQFTQEMGTLKKMAQELGSKERDKFNRIMADTLGRASNRGVMTGETLKTVQSKLSNEARKFSGSPDAYQKELGAALTEAGRIFRESLPRTNPEYSQQLSKANEAWANYARIRQAASSTAAGANEGIFTPAQLAQAVRSLDKSAGKGASAKGQALLQDLAEQGTQVLSSKYPDSGTAGRLAYMLGGGAAIANPALLAGAVPALPYLGPAREITAKLLTQRSPNTEAIADAIRRYSPVLSGIAPAGIVSKP